MGETISGSGLKVYKIGLGLDYHIFSSFSASSLMAPETQLPFDPTYFSIYKSMSVTHHIYDWRAFIRLSI